MTERPLTLFHCPNTRSSGVLALMEELSAPYTLHVLDRGKGENRAPAYLAINPLGKVPALQDGSAIVTEQVAIFLHLADLFPAAGLAPATTDQLRGPYLRWMAFYAASFEPALVDKFRNVEPGVRAMSPYGSYDEVIDIVTKGLEPGPYLLGSTFSAADILWGGALSWTTAFKLVPEHPAIMDYVARITARPAMQRATAKDQALAQAQAEAQAEAGAAPQT
ncbi:glutathione S-transferase family protein [Acidisphaera sp. L21]|uniref:glutathione S-transferase family protein n=1 Tax=Acidisphaera sp. L21 TaxID=1641851 RepID=UPI00131EC529|nr:glutathione S-transferase family protein [Acidisphaera sp. L21]